ncbi:MAG: phosphorylase [Acidobacteria bacterium]|nr:phosphorylase [Acidobacteriota bacterium]
MVKVAIIAAMEREVAPLVRGWTLRQREYEGRQFRFFERLAEKESTVAVCGGIGSAAARRATEAIIRLYGPERVVSAGFAGALDAKLKVGEVLRPSVVIDAGSGSRSAVSDGVAGVVLVTYDAIADPEQKARLAAAYGAQAVDMEAAAVAQGAEVHGVAFAACKAISDEADFSLPASESFVGPEGQFQTGRFMLYVGLRPWLWRATIRLAGNSGKASCALCGALQDFMK